MEIQISAEATRRQLTDLDQHGYAIIPDFLCAERLAAVNQAFDEMLDQHRGRNSFEGEHTERIYTLVARRRLFQDIVEDPRIMALCDGLLMPNYLLTASQAIVIGPGETPQPWHTDDSFYPIPRPRPMISLSTIVAVDAFTIDNGGTEVVGGSHRWNDDQVAGYYIGENQPTDTSLEDSLRDCATHTVMPAGAALVFAGTLLHRGGANNSAGMRRAFSNQYCQPWARPQENFFLGIPTEEVALMSPRIQSLLGYSIHPPFMGQVTASHPLKALSPVFIPPISR